MSNIVNNEVSKFLQKKIYGSSQALQYIIFEAIWKIEYGGYDAQKILDWYNRIEKIYNEIEKRN